LSARTIAVLAGLVFLLGVVTGLLGGAPDPAALWVLHIGATQ
jgi:hypothetical protein